MTRVFIGLFLCFCCASTFSSNAQAFQWAKQLQASYSYGTDIVTDNDFNVISAGWFNDSVDLDPGPAVHMVYDNNVSTGYTSYLSKLDSNGQFVWGHYYNSTLNNRIYSIDVDNQNNILVMGQFGDSIDLEFGPGNTWIYDNTVNNNSNTYWDNIFIAKYDPAGNLIWGKGLHSSSTISNYGLWGHGLKVDGSDNVVLTGRFHDTVDFDPGPGVNILVGTNPVNSAYYGDKFLLKLDDNGNFVWVQRWKHSGNWGNNSWYGSNELDVDGNDNIFLPIVFIDSLDVDPGLGNTTVYTQGLHDISLLKVSPNGNLVWHKEIGSPQQDYCHSLATDPAGNIFYSIQTYSNQIDMDPGPAVYNLSWTNSNWGKIILKLDNNGNFVWALKNLDFNWVNTWYGEGLATDTAGGLYLTTRIWQTAQNNNQWDLDPGPGAYIVSSAGAADIAFQNLDNNGNFIWGGVMGGPSSDYNWGICTDNARGVYLTGYFYQTSDFDPTPNTTYMTSTQSSVDAFVVKLNNCNKVTSQIIQACDSVLYNNQYFFNDTILQSHYGAFNGCDSAHSIYIDVQIASDDTLIVDTCHLYNWNNNMYTSSGFYTQNYGQPNGCDSLVTLDLTIRQKSYGSLTITSCDSTTINGTTYYTSGNYLQLFTNVAGCDSQLVVHYTQSSVDTLVNYNGFTSLQANATGATYQWIDCNTMLPVPGSINGPFFTAPQSGSYACVVTENGCTDTSACYPITIYPDNVTDYRIRSKIYPNPSKGTYHLELDKQYKDVKLEIRNLNGQLIWSSHFDTLQETDVTVDKASGVYMLYIKQGEHKEVKKLLKW